MYRTFAFVSHSIVVLICCYNSLCAVRPIQHWRSSGVWHTLAPLLWILKALELATFGPVGLCVQQVISALVIYSMQYLR